MEGSFWRRLGCSALISALSLLIPGLIAQSASAAQLKEAQVTEVIKDVKLLPTQAAPRPAAVQDTVREGTAVRTGVESRAELTFTDKTLTRLGANTVFSFNEGTRDMNLGDGAMLFQVPKGVGGARIRTAAVTAAITGTTGIAEYHPPTASNPHPVIKFLCLEGTIRLYLTTRVGESVLLHPGQELITDGKSLPDPVDFYIPRFVSTSLFIIGFNGPLPSLNLILLEAQKQEALIADGTFVQTNIVNFGRGTLFTLVETVDQRIASSPAPTSTPTPGESPTPTPSVSPTPTPPPSPTPTPSVSPTPTPPPSPTPTPSVSPTPTPSVSPTPTPPPSPTPTPSVSPTPTPPPSPTPTPSVSPTPTPPPSPTPTPTASPTPSKFGTPSVISSPVPYVITSATVITTDPSITTNGVTDYGKIYRGQLIDGPLSAYLFGSTSAFDTSSGFDTVVGGDMGGAAFKFTSLQLAGDPTIDTTNGEINLGLVGVNGITSGAPGGVLTFAGLRGLLLATQDGPITLRPEISFSGLQDINIYARGSLSDLTLGSDITISRRVFLLAEHDMSVTSNITTAELSARAGRNITLSNPAIIHAETIILSAGQDLTWNGQISDETALNTEGNVDISAGNQISITNDLEIDRRFGGSLTGLNVSFNAGTDLTVGGNLSVFVDPAGLDSGGNVSVLAGNNILIGGDVDVVITTPSVTALTTTTSGGVAPSITIDAGAGDVTVSAGNDLSVGGSFSVSTDKSNLAAGGNISIFTGNNFTIGDFFSLQTFTTAQSGDGGNIDVDVRGSLNAGNLSLLANFAVQAPQGSGENVTLQVGNDLIIHNATDSGGIDIQIVTPVHEVVSSGANLTLAVGGNLVTDLGGSTGLFINNNINQIVNGANISATIGGNLETDNLTIQLLNQGGTINAGGNISFTVSGDLTTHSNVDFSLLNNADGANVAFIENPVTVKVRANNISVGGSLDTHIDNTAGNIVGSATVDFAATGNVGAGDTTFQILNSDDGSGSGAGTISSSASIIVNTGGDLTANSIDAFINNRNGGSIGSFAQLATNIGALTTQADATFGISNRNDGNGGGLIATDASVNIQANSISVGGFLTAFLSANAGGQIGTSATIQFGVTGDLHSGAGTFFDLEATAYNTFTGPFIAPGIIGSDALIHVTAANITSDGFLEADIFDRGGHIGGNANITFGTAGEISSIGDAVFTIGTADNPGGTAGTIGGDAIIDLAATSISSGGTLFPEVSNQDGGSIGSNAKIVLSTGGLIANSVFARINNSALARIGEDAIISLNSSNSSVSGNFVALILNQEGSIGSNATVGLTGGNLTAGSLFAQIDNSGGGLIGSTATVTSAFTGLVTVSGDATFNIAGSAGAADGAAININGGTYDAGGTFLASIDGNGTITFSNAGIHADTIKVGVFGDSGVLRIGGGSISADTLLKLYAPGSNGSIDFVANCTLSSQSTAVVIAANTVTIENSVLVTIGGTVGPALVYTNVPNYTGSGGNGNTTGMFGGAGATTAPLDQAPPFDAPTTSAAFALNTEGPITINSDLESAPSGSAGTVQLNSTADTVTVNSRVEVAPAPLSSPADATLGASATQLSRPAGATGGNISIKSGKAGLRLVNGRAVAVNISSSAQLLALLDAAAPGPGGQITILATGANSDINVNGKLQADRGTVDIRHAADNGNVNLSNADVRADIVKVGALGSNGTLNIGGGTISADTTLKLYAPGSNGTVNFIADVTLTGASAKIIAGDTVKVFDSVVVTIGGSPADIYTNHAHYSQLNGGDGTTTGIFNSSGSTAPPVTTHLSATPPPVGGR